MEQTQRGANDPDVACFGCGDAREVVIRLLRTRPSLGDRRVDGTVRGPVGVVGPGLAARRYEVVVWNTLSGCLAEVEPHEGAHQVVLADKHRMQERRSIAEEAEGC